MNNNYGDECIFNDCIIIDGELLHCNANGNIVIYPIVERIKADENNGYTAFQECTITSLEIPRSLKEIYPNTFSVQFEPIQIHYMGTKKEFESITGKVNLLKCIPMNSVVSCLDGVWDIPDILVENKIIMACLNKTATSITVSEGPEILLEYALEDLPMLQSITLPESMLAIDNYAAVNCPELTEVYIPSGINFKQIPKHAFEAHTHIKKHIYNW